MRLKKPPLIPAKIPKSLPIVFKGEAPITVLLLGKMGRKSKLYFLLLKVRAETKKISGLLGSRIYFLLIKILFFQRISLGVTTEGLRSTTSKLGLAEVTLIL